MGALSNDLGRLETWVLKWLAPVITTKGGAGRRIPRPFAPRVMRQPDDGEPDLAGCTSVWPGVITLEERGLVERARRIDSAHGQRAYDVWLTEEGARVAAGVLKRMTSG